MFNFFKKRLFKKKKSNISENENEILDHINKDDSSIYITYKKRLIPFLYITLMSEAKCSCTIFVKHIDNMMIPGQDLENLFKLMQKNNIFVEIITFEQNEMFMRMIMKLNSQSPTKIQLYIGEVNGVGNFQNFIVTDGRCYMLEHAYPIDYDYISDTIETNYSMNNPLGCKWLIHTFQQYKNRILGYI